MKVRYTAIVSVAACPSDKYILLSLDVAFAAKNGHTVIRRTSVSRRNKSDFYCSPVILSTKCEEAQEGSWEIHEPLEDIPEEVLHDVRLIMAGRREWLDDLWRVGQVYTLLQHTPGAPDLAGFLWTMNVHETRTVFEEVVNRINRAANFAKSL